MNVYGLDKHFGCKRYSSEQNGKRGTIKLGGKVKILNLLEDIVDESEIIEYSPIEIVTIGIPV